MTIQEYNTKVWAFYVRLENGFMETLNYVELVEDNYATYSIEFERLLLAIGSEVDVLCKLLCKTISPDKNPSNILEYANILCGYNDFTAAKVRCEKTAWEITPFSELSTSESPSWWKAYNKVKHQRIDHDNFKQGNLKNVFDSLAALYILNRYYCKTISTSSIFNEPTSKSHLFNMVGWQVCIPIGNGFAHILLPDGSMCVIHE